MKNLLLNRIRQGEFNPSPTIQQTIDSLNKSYSRAKKTVERMHGNDEITLEESMTREFRYYSTEMQRTKQKQFEDEQKKMFELRKELKSIFGMDVWDEVILNYEFETLEQFYDCVKSHIRNNHD
jgi:3-methyladenine DNA glycosylase/8-oxoguanine DNA glycosylase